MEGKIATIVLNWNNAKDTIACLESLRRVEDSHHQVIVVDNGSTDGSLSEIQAAFPEHAYLRNGENLGFAEGNNRGILYALEKGADYLFLLNNDTVVDPEILKAFRKGISRYPQAGALGAKIYFYDIPHVIWHAGGQVSFESGKCFHRGYGDTDLEKKWEDSHEIGYACGCALFMKADVVRSVGLMDPRFFLIWEEIDWCFRMKQAGFPSFFIPEARLWHKVSSSFEGGKRGATWDYFYARNRLLFFKKHASFKTRSSLYLSILLKEKLSIAGRKGMRDFFLKRFGLGSCLNLK